ncbi:MAG: hypothetical protein BroJett011_04510 [Chloroflexota bacterium]|nr:MAG: hypothetical protein BroJett011_04510 [Chloroflexota bacterium]
MSGQSKYSTEEIRQILTELIEDWRSRQEPPAEPGESRFGRLQKLPPMLNQEALLEILPKLLAANNERLLEEVRRILSAPPPRA